MTFRGHFKDGVIVLDEKPDLAEGVEVRVEIIEEMSRPVLSERFKDVIGKAEGLPSDFAENHDHYIHGAPKKEWQ